MAWVECRIITLHLYSYVMLVVVGCFFLVSAAILFIASPSLFADCFPELSEVGFVSEFPDGRCR